MTITRIKIIHMSIEEIDASIEDMWQRINALNEERDEYRLDMLYGQLDSLEKIREEILQGKQIQIERI